MNILTAILKALASAAPGLMALFQAINRKPGTTSDDIAKKAAGEVEELESWKRESLKR